MSQELDSEESSVVEPRLPPELERVIFERAAIGSPKTMVPVLCLVAWRVKKWVAPILARTIVFRAPTAALPAATKALTPAVPTPEMLFPIFSFHAARALFSSPSATHPAGLIRAHLEHVIVSKLSWAETALLFTKHLAIGESNLNGCKRIRSVSLVPQPVTRQWPVRWPIAQLPRGTKSLSTLTHLSIGLYDLLGFVGPLTPGAPSPERRNSERPRAEPDDPGRDPTPTRDSRAKLRLAPGPHAPRRRGPQARACSDPPLPAWPAASLVLAITSVWGTRQHAEENSPTRILDDTRVVFYLPKEGNSLETDWSDALAGRENIWERAERYLGQRKRERNIDLDEPQLLDERT
uniref:Proteophosphoglycan ppg4 n=1 Tax=Mycena chlorophos TaxID=658473 RepID=A0ABQ0M5H8_MYCCL|nr:predicted protein [Mycena chlorophos]